MGLGKSEVWIETVSSGHDVKVIAICTFPLALPPAIPITNAFWIIFPSKVYHGGLKFTPMLHKWSGQVKFDIVPTGRGTAILYFWQTSSKSVRPRLL